MTNSNSTTIIESQEIDDAALTEAIIACRPFEYLEPFKRQVAAHLGHPELATDSKFGYRVYCLNRDVEERQRNKWLSDNGFSRSMNLDELIGAELEMLLGVDSLLGERVIQGTIKKGSNGLHVFIPKGKRTRGYMPGLIRKKGSGPTSNERSSAIIVHATV